MFLIQEGFLLKVPMGECPWCAWFTPRAQDLAGRTLPVYPAASDGKASAAYFLSGSRARILVY